MRAHRGSKKPGRPNGLTAGARTVDKLSISFWFVGSGGPLRNGPSRVKDLSTTFLGGTMNSLFKAAILAPALVFAGGQAASAFDLEHHVKHKHVKHAHAKKPVKHAHAKKPVKHAQAKHKHTHVAHSKKHARKPS
jgi:hypothetical protein